MEIVNIVIPAAGKGSRFLDKGFTTLKPFISWSNKTMLEHLIDGFQSNKYFVNIHIILRDYPPPLKNGEYSKLIKIIEKKYKNVFFHKIKLLTEGTVPTSLFLYDILNNEYFTLLANCDQIIDIKLDNYIDAHKKFKCDGSLLCFTGEHSKKWSFVLEKNNVVERVVAKDNVSDVAVCGWYAWTQGKDFIKYAIQQIINLDKVNNEYYLCPVYNYAIKDNKKIATIKIDKKSMHGVGTPEDLEEYLLFKGHK